MLKINFFFISILLLFVACKGDKDAATNADLKATSSSEYPEIEQLSSRIQQNPSDDISYATRGAAYYEIDSYDNAINDLNKAIELNGNEVEYYHLLADIYMDYFRSRLALETMEKAAEKFPDNTLTLLKLAEFQMTLTKNQDSFKTLDKILKKDPQNAEAFFMMGMNFKDTGDTIRAINSFQEAADRNSQLVSAWLQLGSLYDAIGDPLAANYYDNAIRVAPDQVEPYHAKAYYLANSRNDLEGAIEVYKKINTVDPQYEDAYYNAGLLYMDLKDYSAAHQQFDLAIKFSPTHIRAYFYRGLASEFVGDAEAAKRDYEQALKMAPDYELAREQLTGLEARLAQ
ncbi:MAG: tetratricopeptide repeat protein [Bacteroidota bacterium]